MYICMYVCMNIHTHIHTHLTCIYVCMSPLICMYVCRRPHASFFSRVCSSTRRPSRARGGGVSRSEGGEGAGARGDLLGRPDAAAPGASVVGEKEEVDQD